MIWLLIFFTSFTCSSQIAPVNFTQPVYNATITENSNGKTFIHTDEKMGVYLTEASGLDVRFKIVSGDDDKIFKLEQRLVGNFVFLFVRTKSGNTVLNRERKDRFVLVVKIVTTPSVSVENNSTINIQVLDANDLSPLFYTTKYEETLPEDKELYEGIVRVCAEDADLGMFGDIYYSFLENTTQFLIDPKSGVVSLTKRLKYSEKSFHLLNILAQDRGTIFKGGGNPVKSTLVVKVKQVNLYGPQIYAHNLQNVVENSLGEILTLLRVTDKDKGVHGEILSLDIIDGNDKGDFKVFKFKETNNFSDFNLILLKQSKLKNKTLNLTLRAVDKGFPPRKTYKSITVRILKLKNTESIFDKQEFKVDISEHVPINTQVIKLKTKSSLELRFQITEGNLDNSFRIDSKTGLIYTGGELDAEEKSNYVLTISVVDGDEKTSKVEVKINVIDYNDNYPKFEEIREISAEENQPAGTAVGKIHAFDKDAKENGLVTYSISNINNVPFEIDSLTGVLRTLVVLDYETMRKEFLINVRASDSGLPYRRETEKVVKISLRNVNDNSPKFLKQNCLLYVPKTSPINTVLIAMMATDLDLDVLTYSIISGNNDSCFHIESKTGLVVLKCDFVKSNINERYIDISANDGVHLTETRLRVIVLNKIQKTIKYTCEEYKEFLTPVINGTNASLENSKYSLSVNRNSPKFINFPIEIIVNETTKINTIIWKIIASDEDFGFSGVLVYSLTGDESIFKIDFQSGNLYVIDHLDYELKRAYLLNITVQDLGTPKKSAFKLLRVKILDENDNKPIFKTINRTVRVSENLKIGDVVFKAEASDGDYGDVVVYSLTFDFDFLKINKTSGVVFVSDVLDRRYNTYDAKIRASDSNGGTGNLYSEISIRFIIDKVNKNPPKFAVDKQEVNLPEDIPLGSVVVIMSTIECDVKYSLSDTGAFTIDETNGVVRVASALNYGAKRFYSLTVVGIDSGGLISSAGLFVNVINVNENLYPPVFEDLVMEVSVVENAPVGTTVVMVKATDGDAPGDDSRVGYMLRSGDGLGYFDIDEQGTIKTLRVLDAERNPYFWLSVIAKDHGVVPLSSRLEVFIVVRNQNDNIPLILEPIYYACILENSPHTLLAMVTAEDPDLEPKSNISYKITGGDSGNQFFISPLTGMLTTTGPLDRETQEEYTLEVTVSDNSYPALSSSTFIIISVGDINDNPPRFLQQQYRLVVPGVRQDVTYLQVIAVDEDDGVNGAITYSIDDGPHSDKFHVNPVSGAIYLKASTAEDQEFEVTVKATDSGVPKQSVTTRLTVKVSDLPLYSRHPPVFKHNIINIQVIEDQKTGVTIATVQAIDEDGDYLWYSIRDGDTKSEFAIWDDKLLLVRHLDWEKQRMYNLTVAATDGTHTAHVQVHVIIKQNKKNRPHFTQLQYRVGLPEDVTVGSQLIDVRATGLPTYTIHSARSVTTLTKFIINEKSGTVALAGKLDRELLEEHLLIIKACIKDFCNLTRLTITVEDVNDNPPEWLTHQTNYQIQECTSIGTTIAKLLAVDRDQGDNADVTYVIIYGNFGKTFKIDPKQGNIYLARKLDISSKTDYTIIVKAMDNGRPRLSALLSLQITIAMADTQPPRFLKQEPIVEISENKPPGTIVGHLKVQSPTAVWFEIVEGNDEKMFNINPTTGVVSVRQMLDYERRRRYTLSITATNMAQVTAAYDFTIIVLDYNDNEPVFQNTTYFGFIKENAPIGSFVLHDNQALLIQAEDLDDGTNSMLQFEILEQSARKMFYINSVTGAIEVLTHINYETIQSVNFTVKVSDQGTPRLTSDVKASVHIEVIDVNDCPPVFSQREYNATASLGLPTYSNIILLQVNATDADTSDVTTLKYALHTTNCSAYNINVDTGEIVITEYVKQDCSRFHVIVSDGIFSDSVYVNVNFESTKDSRITFQQELYHGAVLENSTKQTTVAVLNVLGNYLNEHLVFTLLNFKQWFHIKTTSGIVMTTGLPFDRERQEHYLLIVQVRSDYKEVQMSQVPLNITVLDINDNCPIFTHQSSIYYTFVSIKAQKGDFIAKITAVDADSGENGEVKYELVQGSVEIFRIGRKSGEISLKQSLDPGVNEYCLNITAYDGGLIPCSTHTMIIFKVINESMPKWEKPYYQFHVPEDTKLHKSLPVPLRAIARNKILYYITRGNENQMFYIHFETGFLSLNEELDYETTKNYSLTVEAINSISGTTSNVIVDIQVININDCYPTFTADSYNISLPEDVHNGSKLLQIEAQDEDEDDYGVIRYKIQNRTSSSDYFSIDSNGVLSLKKSLDFEKNKMHNLIVAAVDGGIPALYTLVNVWITVTNVNDNSPKFEKSVYTCHLSKYSSRGQFVTHIRATDADHNILQYSFTPGDEGVLNMFFIQPETGDITLTNPNKLTKHQLIILNASVNDGIHTDYCRIRIEIITPTNKKPAFTLRQYEAHVTENLPPGTVVVKIIATLPDSNVPRQIEYSFASQLPDFEIQSDTGEIKTTHKLDREKQAIHWLTVVALSADGQSDWATVKVFVEDVNDNAPKFQMTRYKTCIYSNNSINTPILKIRATDVDEHPANIIKYSIASSQPELASEIFQISSEGDLMTRLPLMSYEHKTFTLTVRATDHGVPSLNTDVTVTVFIMSSEDVLPVVILPEKKITLSKDTRPGSLITQVKLNPNSPAYFELTSNEDIFQIDSKGWIHVLNKLTERSYTLCIIATALFLSTSIVLEIQLTGFSHTVQFESEIYTASILENAGEGVSVLKVYAESSSNDSQFIQYSLYSEDGNFAVEPYTGWIVTLVPLDRETKQDYEMMVVSYNTAHSVSSATTSVLVSVLDVNDNPHRFSQYIYQTAVNEDAHIGTVILQLDSSDLDTEMHRIFQYSITQGDLYSQFCVTDTGQVYVCGQMNRETQDTYNLTVVATDAVFVAVCQVVVTILDVNDEPPLCSYSHYDVSLLENSPTGTALLTLDITDADLEPNFELVLTGQDHNYFTLEQNNKVVKTARLLDTETKSNYRLYVSVRDKSWICVSVIDIDVTDVNDNAPEYSSVSVSLNEGTVFTVIHATDNDKGLNRQLKYQLLNNNRQFTIDSETGLLRITYPLNQHSFTVQTSDQGTPQLYSTINIQISIYGTTDNTAIIAYNISIAEDTSVGTQIVKVGDLSTNIIDQNTVYSIVGGNENTQFTIENITSILRVNKQLDYETNKAYTLSILVTNSNNATFIHRINVNIFITDCNDNAPSFVQQHSLVKVKEDVMIGHQVIQLEATDSDSGVNGQISYRIKNGNTNQQFDIDSETGVVIVVKALDRETTPVYILEIEAVDRGTPQQLNSAYVSIELVDVNDNPPLFIKSNFTAVLQEDRSAGWTVCQLQVTDADLYINNTDVAFAIISGNNEDYFRIDTEGRIVTTAKLILRLHAVYKLQVRVYDPQQPSLYSDGWITIKVVQASQYPPIVHPMDVWVVSYEGRSSITRVTQITVTDDDLYDILSYTLAPPSPTQLFSIDPQHGIINATTNLEARLYDLNVSVTDGKFTTFANVSINVHFVWEEMMVNTAVIRFLEGKNHLSKLFSILNSAILHKVNFVSVQLSLKNDLDIMLASSEEEDWLILEETFLSAGFNVTLSTCECHNGGMCQERLKLQSESTTYVAGKNVSFVTPSHVHTLHCTCNFGFTGDHCEDVQCTCPSLQMCTQHTAGYICLPACSTNTTCSTSAVSIVSWEQVVAVCMSATGIGLFVLCYIGYRWCHHQYVSSRENKPKVSLNSKSHQKCKLNNLEVSQLSNVYTLSPHNEGQTMVSLNNLDVIQSYATSTLDGGYVKTLSKVDNGYQWVTTNQMRQNQAPDLAICHRNDKPVTTDVPTQNTEIVDVEESEDVMPYGFPHSSETTQIELATS